MHTNRLLAKCIDCIFLFLSYSVDHCAEWGKREEHGNWVKQRVVVASLNVCAFS